MVWSHLPGGNKEQLQESKPSSALNPASILEFTSIHSWKDSRALLPPSESGSTLHLRLFTAQKRTQSSSRSLSELGNAGQPADVPAKQDRGEQQPDMVQGLSPRSDSSHTYGDLPGPTGQPNSSLAFCQLQLLASLASPSTLWRTERSRAPETCIFKQPIFPQTSALSFTPHRLGQQTMRSWVAAPLDMAKELT